MERHFLEQQQLGRDKLVPGWGVLPYKLGALVVPFTGLNYDLYIGIA